MNRKEAAARARVCTRTIDRAMEDGKLRHYRLGTRVLTTEIDLDAWIEAQACGGVVEIKKKAA